MTQNRSHAVMAQRAEPPDSFDDFQTPPFAVRAFVEHALLPRGIMRGPVLEPASNRGYMAKALAEYFNTVWTNDVFDYTNDPETVRPQDWVSDFLIPGLLRGEVEQKTRLVITNPPFVCAPEFIERAMRLPAWEMIAVLVRTSFAEGGERYDRLFRHNAPTIIAQYSERVPMIHGKLRKWKTDEKTGKRTRKGTATSYCWMVWARDRPREPMQWIPPCRDLLERFGDYPDDGAE